MVTDEIKSQISEAMKKIALMGVGTAFLTEEAIRSFLGEVKLPKELWSGFIENAQKTKQEFFSSFAKEASQAFNKIDLVTETKKFLSENKIHLKCEIEFEKKDNK